MLFKTAICSERQATHIQIASMVCQTLQFPLSPNPLLVKADVFRERRTFLATVVHHQCNAVSSHIRGYLTIVLYKKGKLACPLFYPCNVVVFARNQALIPSWFLWWSEKLCLRKKSASVSHVMIALHIILAVALAAYPSGRNYHSEMGHSQHVFCAKKCNEPCLLMCARSSVISTQV